jgi:hypothetical protein
LNDVPDLAVSAFVLASWLLGCPAAENEPRELPSRSAEVETWIPGETECRECHDEVATQWSGSLHHASFSNIDFQRSFVREPTDFCRDCHAPALDRLPEVEAEALGVGCLDCHLQGDRLLTGGAPEQPNSAPHALTRSPEFGTEACASCHEFAFPPESWRPAGTMMQTTMTEHAQSKFADRSCADCHMPARDHAFGSTRDDDAIRRALSVTARREGDALLLELEPHEVGHAFPTGDLFRRIELHAELIGTEGQTIASATRYLGRHFEARRHLDGRLNHAAMQPVPDDRIREPTTIRIELDSHGNEATLVWSVDYQRVDDRDNHFPERSTLAGEVRLAGGRLSDDRGDREAGQQGARH